MEQCQACNLWKLVFDRAQYWGLFITQYSLMNYLRLSMNMTVLFMMIRLLASSQYNVRNVVTKLIYL
jgi:hypothetical protein